jgi:SAM-dependent methyltransferase
VRNRAYEAALARVCEDAVVLDLGCGTGVWGLVALRHGARRVYAVEGTGMIDWAKSVARRNGVADRIVYVRGWSKDIDLPEQVDVVVADQFGPFLLEGDGISVMADAAHRLLRPGGTLIPSRIHFRAALSRSPVVKETLDFWSSQPLGLDFEPLRRMAVGTRWYERPERSDLTSEPFLLGTVVPADVGGSLVRYGAAQKLPRDGSANALVGWMDLELAPGIRVSTGPGELPRIDRDAVALPLDPELKWAAGAEATVEITGRMGSAVLAWSVTVAGDRRQSSTVAGSLTGAEDIRAAVARVRAQTAPTPSGPRAQEPRSRVP